MLTVTRTGPSSPSICISPGFSGASGSIAAPPPETPSSSAALAHTNASTGCSFVSRCTTSLKRSASNACNIFGTSSFDAPQESSPHVEVLLVQPIRPGDLIILHLVRHHDQTFSVT